MGTATGGKFSPLDVMSMGFATLDIFEKSQGGGFAPWTTVRATG